MRPFQIAAALLSLAGPASAETAAQSAPTGGASSHTAGMPGYFDPSTGSFEPLRFPKLPSTAVTPLSGTVDIQLTLQFNETIRDGTEYECGFDIYYVQRAGVWLPPLYTQNLTGVKSGKAPNKTLTFHVDYAFAEYDDPTLYQHKIKVTMECTMSRGSEFRQVKTTVTKRLATQNTVVMNIAL